MVEQGPRRHSSAMERAAFLEKRAKELGVPVSKLIPPANSWKPNKATRQVTAVRREHWKPIPEGGPSWTSLVSEAIKNSESEWETSLLTEEEEIPKPTIKGTTVSVYELTQMSAEMGNMPPRDLSTLLTEEEKARPNPKLSPAELRNRRQFKPGVVSALELAGMQTEGDEMMPSHDLDDLESGLDINVVLNSNEPHSLITPSDISSDSSKK